MPKEVKAKKRTVTPYVKPTKDKTNSSQAARSSPGIMDPEDKHKSGSSKSTINSAKSTQADAVINLIDTDTVPNKELMDLLLSIKHEQATKADMSIFTTKITEKLDNMDDRITTQAESMDTMNVRLTACESLVESTAYNMELDKQRQLRNNLSIIGVPQSEDNLMQIMHRLFSKLGVEMSTSDIVDAYRVRGPNIVIVKLSNFTKKQQVLNVKSKKTVSACDVVTGSTTDNSVIYINNHTTPYFGKLLQEGRKLVKEKIIFSCWLNSNGCQIKLMNDSPPATVQNLDQLHAIIEGNKSDNQQENANESNVSNKKKRKRKQNTNASPENKQPNPKKK